MTPVEFQWKKGDRLISAGWWAMPQVPAVGEHVRLIGGEHPSVVLAVVWEYGIVPAAAWTMKAAGLYSLDGGDDKLLARVQLDITPGEAE